MYAIVEIAGKQFRVKKNQRLKVPHLQAESGSKVMFKDVLVYADDQDKTQFGTPLIKDMTVSATVVEHGREKTIIVFKKKRRKGYQKKNGHRQGFSIIKIDDIGVVKAVPKAKAQPKKATADEVKETKANAAVKKTAAAEKEAAPKKKNAAPKEKPAEKKEA